MTTFLVFALAAALLGGYLARRSIRRRRISDLSRSAEELGRAVRADILSRADAPGGERFMAELGARMRLASHIHGCSCTSCGAAREVLGEQCRVVYRSPGASPDAALPGERAYGASEVTVVGRTAYLRAAGPLLLALLVPQLGGCAYLDQHPAAARALGVAMECAASVASDLVAGAAARGGGRAAWRESALDQLRTQTPGCVRGAVELAIDRSSRGGTVAAVGREGHVVGFLPPGTAASSSGGALGLTASAGGASAGAGGVGAVSVAGGVDPGLIELRAMRELGGGG